MSDHPRTLVGDIGGTHARFALADPGLARLHEVRTLKVRDYPSAEAAIAGYLAGVEHPSPTAACFAIAAPVNGSQVAMTNNNWVFDVELIRQQFGLQRVKLVNDFSAMALGVLQVPSEQRIPVGPGVAGRRRPILVIGPGTGLGVSALIPSGEGWLPLATEGGHVDFAPGDDTEAQVLARLREQFGRVSAERVLCGPGLLNLYQALATVRGRPVRFSVAEDISAAATAGDDELAEETLNRFCAILGRVAGDAVLTLGAYGGVYLCGGILSAILPFFVESGFRKAFESKGRMSHLLAETPVWVVTDPCTGLYGAASALDCQEV